MGTRLWPNNSTKEHRLCCVAMMKSNSLNSTCVYWIISHRHQPNSYLNNKYHCPSYCPFVELQVHTCTITEKDLRYIDILRSNTLSLSCDIIFRIQVSTIHMQHASQTYMTPWLDGAKIVREVLICWCNLGSERNNIPHKFIFCTKHNLFLDCTNGKIINSNNRTLWYECRTLSSWSTASLKYKSMLKRFKYWAAEISWRSTSSMLILVSTTK